MARIWCPRCDVHHECNADHRPDGHGGSSVCCPVRAAEEAVRRHEESKATPRLTVKAAFRNGGKALVLLEARATHEQAAAEVRAYLDRGATVVVVERRPA